MNTSTFRMTKLILLPLVVVLVSCVDNEHPSNSLDLSGIVTEVEITPTEIQIGDEVTISLTIYNHDTLDLQLWFPNSQVTDYHILDSKWMIARSSCYYFAVPTQLIILAGESTSRHYTLRLNPNLDDQPILWVPGVDTLYPGFYSVTAGLHLYQDTYPWDTLSFSIVE